MATSAGAVAAAAFARARREVLGHFDDAGAVNPDRAVPYDPPSHLHENQFESLIGQGILKETGSGLFWMDRGAAELEARRRRGSLKIMFVLILAGLVIAAAISMALVRSG